MLIFPAIDLYEGKAVRLYKGDYAQMTVYSNDPVSVARDFRAAGAEWVHTVDLEGAKDGTTPNFDVVAAIAKCGLRVEIGGGIRNMETVDQYIDAGISRVILGTAAVRDRDFLLAALRKHGDRIAVGVDIKDGKVAIKGWTETADISAFDFLKELDELGVSTVISTDISKDGAMQGANHEMYRHMAKTLRMQLIASGGVSSMKDVERLAALGIYGAIVGRAYYTGDIVLKEAIEVAK